MRVDKRELDLNGHKLVLRNAEKEDAVTLLSYLKRVCSETRFLLKEPDEVADLTLEKEEAFITEHNEGEGSVLVIAEYDGVYAGNASFTTCGSSRRTKHRADIGIALYEEYTGKGIGNALFGYILEIIEKAGFEQAELTVVGGNDRAIHLYEKFGFTVCGKIPNANKYDDGTYADDLRMVKTF